MLAAQKKNLKTKEDKLLKSLYFITTEVDKFNRSHIDVCRAALDGGARIIQYREKSKRKKNILNEALKIKELCKRHNATFIVNDWIELAEEVNADGVHLGQNDASFGLARLALRTKIVGLSATNLEEARQAELIGADYIGLGPVFDTKSKDDAAPSLGLEEFSKICSSVSVPITAIGGINKDNAINVLEAGANSLAVISAVANQKDMTGAAKELAKICDEFTRKH